MSGQPVETEVKFRVSDLPALRAGLIGQGATVTQPRHLERNTLFDDAGRSLTRRRWVLRLRDAHGVTLTLKTPVAGGQADVHHKARVELEVTVNDYDTAFALLTTLGYRPEWRYEKYRETFRLGDALVALDHTPIGDFAEVEGPPDVLRPIAERLGLNWATRNLQSYRELFRAAGLTDRTDMVFQPDAA